MTLTEVQQKFVLHWGEMGTRWGINRTVAQIHALLYISPKPLNAEDIAETLAVARSNVSTSLKELQGWRIVKLVHVLGDKRDHFESMRNVWEMFRIVLDERKRREKIAGRIAILDRSLEATLPYIYGLLGIVEADDSLSQMDGQVRKHRTHEAIKRILLGRVLSSHS